MTDGHPGRKSRGSETGNHQISCRIASVPQSTASHVCIIRMPPMPMRLSARQVPRRRSQILGLEDGRSGLDLPGGQIGVRLLCVEGESVLEDGERGWIRLEGESA